MTALRAFPPPESRHFFPIAVKGQGKHIPLPPSSYAPKIAIKK